MSSIRKKRGPHVVRLVFRRVERRQRRGRSDGGWYAEEGPSSFGENTMTPSWFHVAPPGPGNESQITCVVPVLISRRRSFPPAKNPNEALSGDQNGNRPPSVPASGLASSPSIGRSHNCRFSPALAAKT